MNSEKGNNEDSDAPLCYADLLSQIRNSPAVTLEWLESQEWLYLQPGSDEYHKVFKRFGLELWWHGARGAVTESVALYVQVSWITSHPKVAQVEHLRAVLDA
jgi:hypothetical protein